jgi:hypothetical protein
MAEKPTFNDWLGAIGMVLVILAAMVAAVAFSGRP